MTTKTRAKTNAGAKAKTKSKAKSKTTSSSKRYLSLVPQDPYAIIPAERKERIQKKIDLKLREMETEFEIIQQDQHRISKGSAPRNR
jgi:hypothetical protein